MSCPPTLLDLPDDIILIILSELSSHDIVNCSFVCSRLERVSRDHTLWVSADFIKDGRELSTSQAEIALEFVCSRTKSLQIRAISNPEQLFSRRMLRRLLRTCVDLRTLVLENWNLELTVRDYPTKLWRLSIADSKPAEAPENKPGRRKRRYPNCCSSVALDPQKQFKKRSYFFGLFLAIPRLQSLDLSRCHWLDNHSLLALSKCQHLRELSINGCTKMGGCVAYSALAAGMGFSALERLDVRDTNMEDIDLKNFLSKPTIEQIFVGCNMDSPNPRIPLTDKELEEWDSVQQWPEEEDLDIDEAELNADLSLSSQEEENLNAHYPDSCSEANDTEESDSDEFEPPRKIVRKNESETKGKEEVSSNISPPIFQKLCDLPSCSSAPLDAPGPSTSSFFSKCSSNISTLASDSPIVGTISNIQESDGSAKEEEGEPPEKTRQIVAILETIRRVDQDTRKVDGNITVQIRASRRDIHGLPGNRVTNNEDEDGLARGVVLELIRPDAEEKEARKEPPPPPPIPMAGPSNRPGGKLIITKKLPKRTTQKLAMSLKGKVWSPWQNFNEDTVEPRRFRVGPETGDGEDFEEYLEEDGRNVIVLNCMNEGIHRTTHVYTKLDFPKISKNVKPGESVTDDLVRYPVQSKKLQVLALGGCKRVTDVFLSFLSRHDLIHLRLLDVRGTGVTQKGVTNLQAYMGSNLEVLFP